jgi:hypothetical protein
MDSYREKQEQSSGNENEFFFLDLLRENKQK